MKNGYRPRRPRREGTAPFCKASGFTLVEITVVLVVIGLILGAMTIGKDLQRNAEYLKIRQFVDHWAQAYDQYFELVGVVVGDDPARPTGVVNFLGIDDGAVSDLLRGFEPGDLAGVEQSDIPELCGLPPEDEPPGAGTLRNYFIEAGIGLPPGRREGHEDKYLYLDRRGTAQQLTVCFQWRLPDDSGVGNTMILHGLTPDLAKMLDASIDGRAESAAGRFRRLPLEGGPVPAWPDVAADESLPLETVSAAYRMAR